MEKKVNVWNEQKAMQLSTAHPVVQRVVSESYAALAFAITDQSWVFVGGEILGKSA